MPKQHETINLVPVLEILSVFFSIFYLGTAISSDGQNSAIGTGLLVVGILLVALGLIGLSRRKSSS